MPLNNNLMNLMRLNGINEGELASACGIDRTTLNKILNGHTTNPRIQTILAFAHFFKIEISELFDETIDTTNKIQDLAQSLTQLIMLQGSPSLSKLAVSIGISKSMLSKILNNKIANPHPKTLKQIADYFNVSIAELIGHPETNNSNSYHLITTHTLPIVKLEHLERFLSQHDTTTIIKYTNIPLEPIHSQAFIVPIENEENTPHFNPNNHVVVSNLKPKQNNAFILAKITSHIEIFNYVRIQDKIKLNNKNSKHLISIEDFERYFIGTIIQNFMNL